MSNILMKTLDIARRTMVGFSPKNMGRMFKKANTSIMEKTTDFIGDVFQRSGDLKYTTPPIPKAKKSYAEIHKRLNFVDYSGDTVFGKQIDNDFIRKFVQSENIKPYPNREVVSTIKGLTGTTDEMLEQGKNIFLEEMGYPPSMVQILKIPHEYLGAGIMGFNSFGGHLFIADNIILDKNGLMGLLRHELDHMSFYADICKFIGVDAYKKMLLAKHPKVPANAFSDEFWNEAIKYANDLTNTQKIKMAKSIKTYQPPDANLYSYFKYYTDMSESRAYGIEASLLKSLGYDSSIVLDTSMAPSVCVKIRALLDNWKKNGHEVDEEWLINKLMKETLDENASKNISETKMWSEVLNKLENYSYSDYI